MATLKDIAQALNLSVMAVSKALRDAPDISVATKARVIEEARRRNYVPNRAAQNLRSRKSGLLGILVPNINNSHYANYVWGVERQAENSGLQLILTHSLDRADLEIREVQKLIARQVEGLIIVSAIRWQNRLATLEILRPSRIPTVLLGAYPAGAETFPEVSWVVSQDTLGTEMVTEHLLKLGHRDILFLAGPHGSSSSAARFSGYQKALQVAGVPYTDARVFLATNQNIEAGQQAITQALSEGAKFSAVVAFNDNVALGAMQILQQQGIAVPEAVSVVGFGDGLLAANYRVPLTTVRTPQIEMGEAAVRQIIDLQRGINPSPRQLPVELILRQSTKKWTSPLA